MASHNGRLLSCVIATVSTSILPHVLGYRLVSELWNAIRHKYSSLSRSHIHDLKRQIFNSKKTSTMDNYVDFMKNCADKLAASGSPIDDEDLVYHTLNGLLREFDGFKTTNKDSC